MWYFTFLLKFQHNILKANSGDPDRTPRSAASGLGLRCLPTLFVPHKGLHAYMGKHVFETVQFSAHDVYMV